MKIDKNQKIIVIISVFLLIICLSLFLLKDKDVTEVLKKDVLSRNITVKELENDLGSPVVNTMYVMGKDAYINSAIDKSLIKKYNLKEYQTRQKKYVKNIRREFKKRFHYDVERKDNTYTYTITTMYYGLYSSDLSRLINAKIEEKNLDASKEDEKTVVELYKIKVDAMEVLDQNLDVYKNKDNEEVKVEILYEKGKKMNQNELFSLFCNANGLTYPNVNFNDNKTKEEQDKRIEEYKKMLK